MNDLDILKKIKNIPDDIAPLTSPQFKGEPTTPTPVDSDDSLRIANTEYVSNKIAANVTILEDDIKKLDERFNTFDGLDTAQIAEEVKKQLEASLSEDILNNLSNQAVKISFADIELRQKGVIKQIDAIVTLIDELPTDKQLVFAPYKTNLLNMKNELTTLYNTMYASYTSCSEGKIPYSEFEPKFKRWYEYSDDTLLYCQTTINKLNGYIVGLKADATQQAIFNLLTDNGKMQGIYYADVVGENGQTERQLFINGEYAQLKGVKVLDHDNNLTFGIGKDGSVTINAISFTLKGRSIESVVGDSMADSDILKDAVDTAVKDISDKVNTNTQKVETLEKQMGNVAETVKDAISDGIITKAEVKSIKSLFNDIKARQTAVLAEINCILALKQIRPDDKSTLTTYRTSVINSFATLVDTYNRLIQSPSVDIFEAFDNTVTNWNNYVGIARAYCQTSMNNITDKLTSDKLSATREAVFNALTNNGSDQGIYMVEDQLFINGEYMVTQDLKAENSINTKDLYVDRINSGTVPTKLYTNTTVYVNATSTDADDSNEFEEGALFQTIQGAIDAIPDFLNGKNAVIELQTDVTENIRFRGKLGGDIYICMKKHNIYGNVYVYRNYCGVNIYGIDLDNTTTSTTQRPHISPINMVEFDSYNSTIVAGKCGYVYLRDVNVYGKLYNKSGENIYTTQNRNYAIMVTKGGIIEARRVDIIKSDCGFLAIDGGQIISGDTGGYTTKYGFYAITGGVIDICRTSATGGPTNYARYDSETINVASNAKFASSGTSGSGDKPSKPVTTLSDTIKSSTGSSYRTSGSYKGTWSSENVVREGLWTNSYGTNKGLWFFGNEISQFQGKTITKVVLTFTRLAAGVWGKDITAHLRYHGYKSKSACKGEPTLSSWSKGVTIKAYTNSRTTTVTITDSTLLNAIKSGDCKGLGLYNGSGAYQGYSASLKATVYYQG